jgi:hypothetical protein
MVNHHKRRAKLTNQDSARTYASNTSTCASPTSPARPTSIATYWASMWWPTVPTSARRTQLSSRQEATTIT